ncbi:MAG: amino acid permease [Chloroflexi bacterium]|nr:amino acid permease [Chloroflexota bacterium]
MGKRKLKRQLNLLQVIMLGTAGTIAAEIFVLTGHAAGIAGPDAVLALLIGGLLTLSVALNYCELATTYPVTGGAMTYVEEGFGKGLVMFLVGSLDSLSSTFYAALSAIGFAYSAKVFIPGLPVVPVAIGVIIVVGIMHVRGVKTAGNLQILLGGFLLMVFTIFIVRGLTHPNGFHWETFQSGKVLFENQSAWANISRMLMTIALVYNAYVGFEVIADDAEEITNPQKNIPLGILVSLGITTVIYSLVSLVTIGTVPYTALAGSETALTDAVHFFWPRIGVPVMGIAGIIATLTSVNSAMLSATREAYTLSREGIWPRMFSRLSHWRTPYVAIILVVIISALVSLLQLVDLLSYISSAGYMFVLFWATLAMLRLRKKYPNIERPFKVPFFPLTAYMAAASGILIIAFASHSALLFLGIVLFVLSVIYYISKGIGDLIKNHEKVEEEVGGGRILVTTVNPKTAVGLVKLATRLAEHQEDTSVCLFSVVKAPLGISKSGLDDLITQKSKFQNELLQNTAPIAQGKNVPIYTKYKVAPNVETGILNELKSHNPIQMILIGWPSIDTKLRLPHNIIKEVLLMAHKDVGILRDRGLNGLQKILVPVGCGPNARLAIKLASKLAYQGQVKVTVLRVISPNLDEEARDDALMQVHEIIEEELGIMPDYINAQIKPAPNVIEGIIKETEKNSYDLLIIGAAEEVYSPQYIFGKINDILIDEVSCSMLVVRHFQAEPALWLRQQIKQIEE